MKDDVIVYLNYDDALDLVDRIASRALGFGHDMSSEEKESMAQLLSDIGVQVSDIVNVDRLADEYAINAEIVTPKEACNYNDTDLDEALFSWTISGEKYYCIQW